MYIDETDAADITWTEQFLHVRAVGRAGRGFADRCNVGEEAVQINL